jgi:chorismate mutase
MMVRGVRGAIQVKKNDRKEIFEATQKLLKKIIQVNQIQREDIASVFLTATTDLNADFPAYAVRQMGWKEVPLLCAQEIEVPHGLPRVIRILLHFNTDRPQSEVKHQYLDGTRKMRPDLFGGKR